MTPDLRDRLQATLSTVYVVDRELGGGGMSRCFVATDVSLGRPAGAGASPADKAFLNERIARFLVDK